MRLPAPAILAAATAWLLAGAAASVRQPLEVSPGAHVCIVGGGAAEAMQHSGWLEVFLHSRFPGHRLVIRNLAVDGDEIDPDRRLRSADFGSRDQWLSGSAAIPRPEAVADPAAVRPNRFELTGTCADVVLAFFGSNEAHAGMAGLAGFRDLVARFITHTRPQRYNGVSAPTTEWTLADLETSVAGMEWGRSFAHGRELFRTASCAACHRLAGEGDDFGPQLSRLSGTMTALEITRHVLEPSLRIDAAYRATTIVTDDGRSVTGLVVEETPVDLAVVENPVARKDPVRIAKSAVEQRTASPASIMPKGLLDRLSRDEVLDLVAYVAARGEQSDCLFSPDGCPHHAARPVDPWLDLPGDAGPGRGKRIVLVSGDEEYRSEEALTQLARILAVHHGFDCRVVYAIDPELGTISPAVATNIPGLEALRRADLMVIATRFRRLPDAQMREIDAYLRRGGPVVGMRTATHAFLFPDGGAFAHYGNGYGGDRRDWADGFGRVVLGERWISHHGGHGTQSTRGLLSPAAKDHPILRGIADGDIWGPTDVYGVRLPLPGDSMPLVLGQVLQGMGPDDPPVAGRLNDPMMPVAWTKTYAIEGGPRGRVFTTTMGAATDLVAEGTRRMLVNACYWAIGLEDQIPTASRVDVVGGFEPTPFGMNGERKGVKPGDLR